MNNETVEVEDSTLIGYRHLIIIKDIAVLDLDKVYTVKVNDTVTLTLSALSYCKPVVNNNNKKSTDAAKALYEFFLAAGACSES